VQVLNAADNLLEKLAGFFFFQFLLLHDVVEKLASADVLHNQKELLWRLNDFKELDDVGVPYQFENVDFTGDSEDVSILGDLPFFKDLHCHLHNTTHSSC